MKKALTGEGSRGGHVIGHTSSGRPIYERKLNRAALEHTLAHGHFSIISAGKNPSHPEEKDLPADHETFRQRHEQLRADLENHGFSYTEVEGHYGGRERSFIVHHGGAPKKDANKAFLVHHEDVSEHEIIRRLGQKYRQESVIHSKAGKHELHYTTGSDAGKHHKGEGHAFVPASPDYYTKVEHPDGAMSKFTLNFDWDKKHSFDDALHKAGYIMDLINANLDLLRKSGTLVEDCDLIEKAGGHKYVRRVFTGGKRKYRYIYSDAHPAAHDSKPTVGEKVKVEDKGKEGHYEVTHVHDDGHVTLRHDETGAEMKVHGSKLKEKPASTKKKSSPTKVATDELKSKASLAGMTIDEVKAKLAAMQSKPSTPSHEGMEPEIEKITTPSGKEFSTDVSALGAHSLKDHPHFQGWTDDDHDEAATALEEKSLEHNRRNRPMNAAYMDALADMHYALGRAAFARRFGKPEDAKNIEKHVRLAEERLADARKVYAGAEKEAAGAPKSMMADDLTSDLPKGTTITTPNGHVYRHDGEGGLSLIHDSGLDHEAGSPRNLKPAGSLSDLREALSRTRAVMRVREPKDTRTLDLFAQGAVQKSASAEVVIASHHDRVAGRAPPSGLYDALGAGVVVADTRERPRFRAPVPTMVDLSKGADDVRAPLAYRKPVPATDPIDLAKSAVREALLEGYRLHLTALDAQNPVAQRIAKSAASMPGSRPSVAPELLREVAGAPVDETAVVDYAAGALKVAAKRNSQLRDGLSRLGVSRRTLTETLAAMQLTPTRVLAGF